MRRGRGGEMTKGRGGWWTKKIEDEGECRMGRGDGGKD